MYTLLQINELARPWIIRHPDGAHTFTLDRNDERFARELLKNLNTGAPAADSEQTV